MKSSHGFFRNERALGVINPEGCRSVWKMSDGWSGPGHWDQNKRAANVSVCLPHREGQSETITAPSWRCCGCVGGGKAHACERKKINLSVLWIFRWLLACTWPTSYQRAPLQVASSLSAPSCSHTALEVVICNILFIYLGVWRSLLLKAVKFSTCYFELSAFSPLS